MNTRDQLVALANEVGGDFHEFTFARLTAILAAWEGAGEPPSEVKVLSTFEYAALVLAAGREDLLGRSPVGHFLLMDGWLQKWVMETRGWGSLVGTRIGV